MFTTKRPRKGYDYYLVAKTRRDGKDVKTDTVIYFGRLDNQDAELIRKYITKVDQLKDEELSIINRIIK